MAVDVGRAAGFTTMATGAVGSRGVGQAPVASFDTAGSTGRLGMKFYFSII
jgi:hypothetical protein